MIGHEGVDRLAQLRTDRGDVLALAHLDGEHDGGPATVVDGAGGGLLQLAAHVHEIAEPDETDVRQLDQQRLDLRKRFQIARCFQGHARAAVDDRTGTKSHVLARQRRQNGIERGADGGEPRAVERERDDFGLLAVERHARDARQGVEPVA